MVGAFGFEQRRVNHSAPTHTSVFAGHFGFVWRARHPGKAKFPRRRAVAKCAADCTKKASFPQLNLEPTRGAVRTAATPGVVLKRAAVEGALSRYTSQGDADSTRQAYASGRRRFGRLCEQVGLQGLPASERALCMYILCSPSKRGITLCNNRILPGSGVQRADRNRLRRSISGVSSKA